MKKEDNTAEQYETISSIHSELDSTFNTLHDCIVKITSHVISLLPTDVNIAAITGFLKNITPGVIKNNWEPVMNAMDIDFVNDLREARISCAASDPCAIDDGEGNYFTYDLEEIAKIIGDIICIGGEVFPAGYTRESLVKTVLNADSSLVAPKLHLLVHVIAWSIENLRYLTTRLERL